MTGMMDRSLLTPLCDCTCTVVAHTAVSPSLRVLHLKPVANHRGEAVHQFVSGAGQFVMLDVGDGFQDSVFQRFRRPMSVYRCHDDGTFEIFYKIHGEGTRLLAQKLVGSALRVLGPLGHPFSTVDEHNVLLVGGGIGIAPLVGWLEQACESTRQQAQLVYGVRTAEEVGIASHLDALLNTWALCTDDGSAGMQGTVVDWLNTYQPKPSAVLVCGPWGMMVAVSQWFAAHHPQVPVWTSLEERMPCGTGACTGCVVFRKEPDGSLASWPSKICLEGPVFRADTIEWNRSQPLVSACSVQGACE
ncbi:MAG: hypothetical protein U0003_05640 [Vampirovibrionales bacterium]